MANNEVTCKAVAENSTGSTRANNPYEKALIQLLEKALTVSLCTATLDKNFFLYEDLCTAGRMFIEKVVLPAHWSMLQSLRLQRPEAADMCVTHIFFIKLDYTLKRETANEIIKLINTMVDHYLKDLWRKEKRHLRGISIDDDTSSGEKAVEYDPLSNAPALSDENMPTTKKASSTKKATEHEDWKTLSRDCRSISYEDTLTPGDKVVHKKFGMGHYDGMEVIRINGTNKRYIKISYADRDTLYVPAEQLDMVVKYVGTRAAETAFTKVEDRNTIRAKTLSNVHFDQGWNFIASGDNLEERASNCDMALAALKALKENTNAYEVVCFLETKMVGDKAGNLSHEFAHRNQNDVCERVLKDAIGLFQDVIQVDFFRDAAFRNEGEYQVNINGNVSHASDRCRNKVLRSLAKHM